MLYPQNFETKIGFDKVRNILKNFCLSELGKNETDNIQFTNNYDYIADELSFTQEFKHICIYADDFPTSFYFDVRPFLKKIKIDGTFLSLPELYDLKRSLDSIKAIISFFNNSKEDEYPNLKKLLHEVKVYPFVTEKINRVINKNGEIKDGASTELQQIRNRKAQKLSAISKIMHELLKRAMQEGWLEQDTTLTIRDGKMLIPVPASYKRKIKGAIYDESATGKTSFIEPIESIEINNEIRELEFEERREIIKILTILSNELRPYIDELLIAYDFLAKIDFIRAKSLFAIQTEAVKPNFENRLILDFRVAKHPLLFLTLKAENKKVIPLDIEISEKQRLILISGPNAGGKSVCLKTVGLLQYMLQCGLLIPVNENSVTGIFDKLFIDIGDEQSIENDLSTYSSHLINMKHFVENANENTLILIDEFGAGTEPMLGGAIAESILQELNHKQVKGIITTHYTNLKHFASQTDGIVNGAMLYDNKNMIPLFQLETGKPGSSFAFEIARKIGLPDTVLKNAEQKLGVKHINFEKHLQEIEEERRTLKLQLQKIQTLEDDLDKKIGQYHRELELTLNQRKNILNLTKEQAKNILNTVNKTIENTVYEIRQNQAEKEKTKQLREDVEEFKENLIKNQEHEEAKILAKIELLKQKELERLKRKTDIDKQQKGRKKEIENQTKSKIKIGCKVKLAGQDVVGEVIEIKEDNCLVSFGSIQMLVEIDKLEQISNNEAKKIAKTKSQAVQPETYQPENKRGDFLFGLDIRGKRADEALQTVMRYLDEALIAGATEIRILHGTGNGILRQIIRDYLKTVDIVKSVRDEKIQAGGAGITIVELEY